MKLRKITLITAALITLGACATSCGEDNGKIQWWDWSQNNPTPDPEPEPEPAPEPEPEPEPPTDPFVEKGWTDASANFGALPGHIKVYSSPENVVEGKKCLAYIAVADAKEATFSVLGEENGYNTPGQFYEAQKHAVIINGGFFWDGASLSLIWRDGAMVCPNVQVDSPDWNTTFYYMPRGTFAQRADGSFFVGWTYTTTSNKTYWYPTSMPLEAGKIPSLTYPAGGENFEAATAIGGGPVLVREGKVINSHEDEYLLINPTSNRPRTAIGYNPELDKLVYFVCQGDGYDSCPGLTLEDVANVMLGIGCTETCNLDGGGSSCMLINGIETIKPSDGKQRSVVSAVALD